MTIWLDRIIVKFGPSMGYKARPYLKKENQIKIKHQNYMYGCVCTHTQTKHMY